MSLDNSYITAQYLREIGERMRALKELTYKHMAITPGATLLDAGCGPGVDTLPLAALTGENGLVIGVDSDKGMLAEADRVAAESPCHGWIEHRHGSVLDLPLDADAVDACRAERLLQVLPPELAQTVLSELIRVTRPGGRVVLVDTDWGSASIDFPDARLERRLIEFFTLNMRPNGVAGRQLYALCRKQGLEDIRVEVVPVIQHTPDETPFGDWLIETATAQGRMTVAEAIYWQEELQLRAEQQRFYACLNMVVASGRKPRDPLK